MKREVEVKFICNFELDRMRLRRNDAEHHAEVLQN